MGSTQMPSVEANQDESKLFALQLATACALPMVLKAAIELDLLEIMAKKGPDGSCSASELAAQVGATVNNPDAPLMLDRMCSLFTSHSVVTCTLKKSHDGGHEYYLKDAVLDGGISINKAYVDVGGVTGASLKMIISKQASLKGINFDLPHVIEEAKTYPEIIFPEALDSTRATQNVLHIDMIMMAYNPGGKERTQKEFFALAKGAGFKGFLKASCVLNMWVMELI
ncbi:caffeic acid 3-O-methyltransferase 2 [Artemisia annua]|uniref:Caffeic acid 3-O-methyltransferase 2 n=1 Tax=Artemisia annua TaxID=35608 RepID=A0A2U1LG07_ARTAN|nr:caffeic acid 3-O-methyltransferase 2 [Artemisia annua]